MAVSRLSRLNIQPREREADVLNDFAPISRLTDTAILMVVWPELAGQWQVLVFCYPAADRPQFPGPTSRSNLAAFAVIIAN
jgi:hypothetical protein